MPKLPKYVVDELREAIYHYMCIEGLGLSEIARKLGKSKGSIYYWIKKLEIKCR